MHHKPIVLKLCAALAAIVLMLCAAIAAAPFLIDGQALRKELVSRLEQMTGGKVAIEGRVRLTSFVSLSVKAENVKASEIETLGPLTGFDARRIEAQIGWLDLIRGNGRFGKLIFEGVSHRLAAHRLVLSSGSPMPFEGSLPQLFSTLDSSPFDEIVLRDSRFKTVSEAGIETDSPLHIVNSKLRRGSSQITLKGRLRWKNELLNVHMRRAAPESGPDRRSHPFKFEMRSRLANLAITGQLQHAPKLHLTGKLKFTAPDFGALPAWAGFGWTSGEVLRAVAIDGAFAWKSNTFMIGDGTFSLNGSLAEGAITLKTSDGCPHLDGTLAFSLLDLNGWQRPRPQDAPPRHDLLTCMTADLRVSAERLATPKFSGGPAAAAVTLKQGRLNANIAELELFDGVLRGAIEVDLNKPVFAFSMRTTAEDMNISHFAKLAGSPVFLDGRATINSELAGSGQTFDELAASLKGHAKIYLSQGGTLGPAVMSMLTSLQPQLAGAKQFMPLLEPDFLTLKAELFANQGIISARSLEINQGAWVLAGQGSYRADSRHVDGRLEIRKSLNAAATLTAPFRTIQSGTHVLTINGPWNNPKVGFDGRKLFGGEHGNQPALPY